MADSLVALTTAWANSSVCAGGVVDLARRRGPVLYARRDEVAGWETLLFINSAMVQPEDTPIRWTEPDDQRITMVGGWLRRSGSELSGFSTC